MAQSATRLAELLKARSLTIAVAETSAGGLVASKLLARPGASGFFRGGIVCYSAQAKRALLPGLPEKLAPTATEKHALQLAVALRELLEVDYAIGESGVAGPSKNSRGIAPGVDAVAVAGPDGAYRRGCSSRTPSSARPTRTARRQRCRAPTRWRSSARARWRSPWRRSRRHERILCKHAPDTHTRAPSLHTHTPRH